VDPEKYHPVNTEQQFDLGYLGTYSPDRQTALDDLLLAPARRWKQGRFAVAGPQYPESVEWPANVHWTIHLSPREHPMFYGSQRFTLNITRQAMRRAGYSPSVRLFEAGACRVPVISDSWPGLDSVFRIGREVLVAEDTEAVLRLLHDMSDSERLGIADAARWRILAEHTPEQRALQLEGYWKEMNDHVSSGQTLRNGRGRSIPGGVEAGLPSERERAGTSADAVETTVEVANSSCVHQSAGASCGDC
jgi:spore maturation protein CgeB